MTWLKVDVKSEDVSMIMTAISALRSVVSVTDRSAYILVHNEQMAQLNKDKKELEHTVDKLMAEETSEQKPLDLNNHYLQATKKARRHMMKKIQVIHSECLDCLHMKRGLPQFLLSGLSSLEMVAGALLALRAFFTIYEEADVIWKKEAGFDLSTDIGSVEPTEIPPPGTPGSSR